MVKANSFALMLIVIIFCFIALKCIILLNSLILYLLKLYLVFLLFVNAILLYIKKTYSFIIILLNSKAKYFVFTR